MPSLASVRLPPVVDVTGYCQMSRMSGRFLPLIALTAVAVTMTSCQIGVAVEVSGSAIAPLFEIAEQGWGAQVPPVFGDFTVAQQDGDRWSTAWAFSRPRGG